MAQRGSFEGVTLRNQSIADIAGRLLGAGPFALRILFLVRFDRTVVTGLNPTRGNPANLVRDRKSIEATPDRARITIVITRAVFYGFIYGEFESSTLPGIHATRKNMRGVAPLIMLTRENRFSMAIVILRSYRWQFSFARGRTA